MAAFGAAEHHADGRPSERAEQNTVSASADRQRDREPRPAARNQLTCGSHGMSTKSRATSERTSYARSTTTVAVVLVPRTLIDCLGEMHPRGLPGARRQHVVEEVPE